MANSITLSKGSTEWGSELNAYKLELIATEISTEGNASKVWYLFQLHSGNNAFSTWTTERAVILNGVQVAYDKSQVSLSKNSTLVYFEGTATVEHNDDGTLDMPIEAYIEMTADTSNTWTPSDERVTLTGTLTLTPIENYSACTAPTSFTASPAVWESTITLSWSGEEEGKNNTITGFDLQYATSDDGETWGAWSNTAIDGNSPIVDTPGIFARGRYIKYRIRTKGSAGASYYSGWKESNGVRKNSLPGAPSNPSISTFLALPEDEVTVSWEGSVDVDDNLVGYQLAKAVNGEEMEPLSQDDMTDRTILISGSPGDVLRFYVRAEDALGAVSDWVEIGIVRINTPPSAPTAACVSAKEYTPGDELTISWSGAVDPDSNISGYEISCGTSDPDAVPEQWSVLAVVETSEESGSYRFVAGELTDYYMLVHFRIRAVDKLGAYSGWTAVGTVLRKDIPFAMVGNAGSLLQHIPHVAEGGNVERYMPYIYMDGAWIQHPGKQ